MTDAAHTLGRASAHDLLGALDGAASMLDPVPLREVHDGGFSWSVDGQPIVTWSGASAAFRVGPDIAAAARNTPDAAESTLGRDWVAFSPAILDGHARDRIRAWFAAAHRRVGAASR